MFCFKRIIVLALCCTFFLGLNAMQKEATSSLFRRAMGYSGTIVKTSVGAGFAAISSRPVLALGVGVVAGSALYQIPYTRPYMQKLYLFGAQMRCRNWNRPLQNTVVQTAAVSHAMKQATQEITVIDKNATKITNELCECSETVSNNMGIVNSCIEMLKKLPISIKAQQKKLMANIALIHQKTIEQGNSIVKVLQTGAKQLTGVLHAVVTNSLSLKTLNVLVEKTKAQLSLLLSHKISFEGNAADEFGRNLSSVALIQNKNCALLNKLMS